MCISFAPLLGAPILAARTSKSLVAKTTLKPLTPGRQGVSTATPRRLMGTLIARGGYRVSGSSPYMVYSVGNSAAKRVLSSRNPYR